jgi:hypothetical protein
MERKESKEPYPGLAPKKDKGKRILLKDKGKGIKDKTDSTHTIIPI